ncbi:MAG: ribonuclease R [Fusobacteriota bacterium]
MNATERIKEYLENNDPTGINKIIEDLNLSRKHKKKIQSFLKELEEEGLIVQLKNNKYTSADEDENIDQGKLTIINGSYGFVDNEEESYFIPPKYLSNAMNDDKVLIEIIKEKDGGKKEAKIIKVLERASKEIIGILQKKRNFGFVKTFGKSHNDIYINTNNYNGAEDNDLVLVELYFWGSKDRKPEGKITKVLGDPYNSDVRMEALILEYGYEEDFSNKVKNEVNKIKGETKLKKENRKDLTDLRFITIDGEDAKDLDDSIYLEKTEKGNYKLYVSIADVSHYVRQGTALDKEAQKRGNSVYLADRVIPMLPRELSNNLCSLNEDTAKKVFTAEILYNPQGGVISEKTYKAKIMNYKRMTYTNVNKILDNEIEASDKENKTMFNHMLELSKILRDNREQRGAIDFELPEIKLILDDDKKVKEVKLRKRGKAEKLIEDFMIAANEIVAEKLFWLDIPSIYRTHEIPDREDLDELNKTLAKFGYKLSNLDKIHPGKFQKILEKIKEDPNRILIRKEILRSLKKASYTVANLGHFALASNFYTHFTSPIRRYSDLLVHRILNQVLTKYPSKNEIERLTKTLEKIAPKISDTERKAIRAEEESVKIKLVEYMSDKVGEIYEGKVTGMKNNGMFITLSNNVEAFWNVFDSNDFYEYNKKSQIMLEKSTQKEYTIGDAVKVIVSKVDFINLRVEVFPVKEE